MHKYLNLADFQLLSILTERIAQVNPRIKIGEQMTGPCAAVHKGKIVNLDRVITEGAEILSLDIRVPHWTPPHEVIQARSIKLTFADVENPEWSSFPYKYIYPLSVEIPHSKWMLEHKPGDTVLVYDDAFDASPLTLTEEHFKMHEYLIFRFGASN